MIKPFSICKEREIKVGLAYEDFLEMITAEHKWRKKCKELEKLGVDTEWMFYDECRMLTPLDRLMEYNVYNLMLSEGDYFYDKMTSDDVSDEEIAKEFYPHFDFVQEEE